MIIATTPTIMGTIILFIVVIIFKLLANDSLSFIHKKTYINSWVLYKLLKTSLGLISWSSIRSP